MSVGVFLFFFGTAFGSFLNVLGVRYDPDRFLLAEKVIGGRSKCPHCRKTLCWFELVPVLSYVAQGGKCRRCKENISPQYLVVEVICGLIFLFVPIILGEFSIFNFQFSTELQTITTNYNGITTSFLSSFHFISIIWILAFLILLLISIIDLRLFIIPDELTLALTALGATLGLLGPETIVPRVLSALGAGGFFLLVFEVYRRIRHTDGMGFGDVKLAAALGLLLGFPNIFIALCTSFVLGAVVGLGLMMFGKSGLKTAVPFGPFLACGTFIAFAWGNVLLAGSINVLLFR